MLGCAAGVAPAATRHRGSCSPYSATGRALALDAELVLRTARAGGGKLVPLGVAVRGRQKRAGKERGVAGPDGATGEDDPGTLMPCYYVGARHHYSLPDGPAAGRAAAAVTTIAMVRHAQLWFSDMSGSGVEACNPGGRVVARPFQLNVVVDMAGFRLQNREKGLLKFLGELEATCFPGVVHTAWIVAAPTLVWMLWRVIRPMVSQKWLDTIRFVDFAELPAEVRAKFEMVSSGSDTFNAGFVENATAELARTAMFPRGPLLQTAA